MLALLSLAATGAAPAETLGDARQLSRLGEPLRLAIPLRADGGAPVVERCVAVVGPAQSDGLPHILTARAAIERHAGGAMLTITTAAPIREPVARLVVRTHCDGATRLYTLFLEPAGSTRQVRAVAQPGPRILPNAAAGPAERVPPVGPAVTIIPVVPAPRGSSPSAALPATPRAPLDPARSRTDDDRVATTATLSMSTEAAVRSMAVAPPVLASSSTEIAAASPLPDLAADPAALEAENATLRQQISRLNGELQRLQQPPASAPATTGVTTPPRATDAPIGPGWEVAWPVAVALGGLAALTVGGFVWRRRHAGEEWALTGPPSHRVASRTSLAEAPVTFKQGNMRHEQEPTAHASDLPQDAAWAAAPTPISLNTPTPLLLQPSAEDLGRDLERELFIAERAHSALERSHPEVLEALTRCWGTAAARTQLRALLQVGSAELARMSGDAVAELRLLVRIADDLGQRTAPESAAPYRPPAPAW